MNQARTVRLMASKSGNPVVQEALNIAAWRPGIIAKVIRTASELNMVNAVDTAKVSLPEMSIFTIIVATETNGVVRSIVHGRFAMNVVNVLILPRRVLH